MSKEQEEVRGGGGEKTRVRLQLEFRLKVGAQSSLLSCQLTSPACTTYPSSPSS